MHIKMTIRYQFYITKIYLYNNIEQKSYKFY